MKSGKLVPIKLFIKGFFLELARNKWVAARFPFRQPSLLLISFPRSGSSWLGKILATSPGIAYLREPVTQPYMQKYGGKNALVDLDRDQKACAVYSQLCDDAFGGRPPVFPFVVNRMFDFHITQRSKKQILVKEVNPRAIRFYASNYHPKVLFLIRHPAAVALSFYQLGWLDSPDVQMETGNPTAGPWEKFGYAYGTIMQDALDFLKEQGNYEIVIYEDFADSPFSEFIKLFNTLGLEPPKNYDQIINQYCYTAKAPSHKGEIQRSSKNMIHKWQTELTAQQINDLKGGFCHSQLAFYRDPDDWLVQNMRSTTKQPGNPSSQPDNNMTA